VGALPQVRDASRVGRRADAATPCYRFAWPDGAAPSAAAPWSRPRRSAAAVVGVLTLAWFRLAGCI
jgi:hypothetical protein